MHGGNRCIWTQKIQKFRKTKKKILKKIQLPKNTISNYGQNHRRDPYDTKNVKKFRISNFEFKISNFEFDKQQLSADSLVFRINTDCNDNGEWDAGETPLVD